VRKHTFCFGLLLLLLAGCAYNDNSHLRSAVPLNAGQKVMGLGYTNATPLYSLHVFEPAEINSTIHAAESNEYFGHAPLSFDIGLNKDFLLGIDMGVRYGPRFERKRQDEFLEPLKLNSPFIKASVQKSADCGHGFWAALSPASSGYDVIPVTRLTFDLVFNLCLTRADSKLRVDSS
jgi:hypothetical protein